MTFLITVNHGRGVVWTTFPAGPTVTGFTVGSTRPRMFFEDGDNPGHVGLATPDGPITQQTNADAARRARYRGR